MNGTKTVLLKTAIFGFFPGIVGVSLLPANMAWLLSFVALMTGLTAFAIFMAIFVFGQIRKQFVDDAPITYTKLNAEIAAYKPDDYVDMEGVFAVSDAWENEGRAWGDYCRARAEQEAINQSSTSESIENAYQNWARLHAIALEMQAKADAFTASCAKPDEAQNV